MTLRLGSGQQLRVFEHGSSRRHMPAEQIPSPGLSLNLSDHDTRGAVRNAQHKAEPRRVSLPAF